MLDVLEFYTDHQKNQYEEYGLIPGSGIPPSGSSVAAKPSYPGEVARFGAGTGLAGAKPSPSPNGSAGQSSQPFGGQPSSNRPAVTRQDSSPNNAPNAQQQQQQQRQRPPPPVQQGSGSTASSSPYAAPPAQYAPQATRPAPPRPQPPQQQKQAQPPRSRSPDRYDNGRTVPSGQSEPKERERKEQAQDRPVQPAQDNYAQEAAPTKPLQTKKAEPQRNDAPAQRPDDGVAAAAAALENKSKAAAKEAERRISTLTEAQIMDKLRQVVSQDDPRNIYATIKKIGQGYVLVPCDRTPHI